MHPDEEDLVRVTIGVLGGVTGTLALAIQNLTMVIREEGASPVTIEILEAVDLSLATLLETTARIQERFPPGETPGFIDGPSI